MRWLLLTGLTALAASPALADEQRSEISAAQLFVLADAAQGRGDFAVAEAAYRALAGDPAQRVRSEARFRLGMMLAGRGRPTEAALLFRQILDEEPRAQRVRLELARVLAAIGDEAGARRALREAQAGGLPPDVARLVDRYSAALRAQKPFGASLEIAMAPDSNVNRATRSETLGTVLGDFTLDEEARARSGLGLSLKGQVYGRLRLSAEAGLLARLSGSGDLYGHSEFNDMALGFSTGPELHLGSDRLTAEAGVTWRWYGGAAYSVVPAATLTWLHPLGRRSQLRASAALGLIDNRRNPLQDGHSYALSLTWERALSSRAGLGVTLSGDRQALRDPGYATAGGQVSAFVYREAGAATLIASIGYGRLEADARLAIFPRRRVDDLYRASLTASFRKLRIREFSPFLRVTGERNRSSVGLYDYRRVRTEIGIARAF